MENISVLPAGSSLREKDKMKKRIRYYLNKLNTIEGYNFISAGIEEDVTGARVYLVLSGGTETQIINTVGDTEEPIILIAHPYDNSFAAALEIVAYLQAKDKKVKIVQTVGDWKNSLEELLEVYTFGLSFEGKKIGRMGHEKFTRHPFAESIKDLIKKNWGPEIIDISLSELEDYLPEIEDGEKVTRLTDELLGNSTEIVEPDNGKIKEAVKIYFALKDIVNKYDLSGIAVKCFDLLPILENTACYALAKLNDEGKIAACEGDVVSALGMIMLYELTDEEVFLANPSKVDLDKKEITFAHCTIPMNMCEEYTIRSHFESGIGVALQGNLYKDNYTMARLGGKNLDDIFVAQGNLIQDEYSSDLCRTQLTLRLNNYEDVEAFLNSPLGNHHLIVKGDYKEKIMSYYNLFLGK
ncbi:MAG: hypothetical protein ACOCQN_00375 [Halanaerobiaceae bacterium]